MAGIPVPVISTGSCHLRIGRESYARVIPPGRTPSWFNSPPDFSIVTATAATFLHAGGSPRWP